MINIEITILLKGIEDTKAGAEAYLEYYLRTSSSEDIVSFKIEEMK